MYGYMCTTYVPGALGHQQRVPDSLELDSCELLYGDLTHLQKQQVLLITEASVQAPVVHFRGL